MIVEGFVKTIKDSISVTLETAGFKKKGKNTFLRQPEDVIQIIEFQKSVKSSEFSLVFTINLGVYSQRLAREQERPEAATCHWRTRLGNLLPKPQDRWWDVANEADAAKAGQEVSTLLVRYGLPTLDDLSSTSKLKQLWMNNQSPGLTEFQRQEYLSVLGGL